ncbi:MAG: hypothetical protein KKC21_03880, partial [Nitrospinae bacterium]|nr:hypothetical protein [Nitrospinota bacterium]
MICSNPELSKLDDKLATGYWHALEDDKNITAGRKEQIRKVQREWVKERNTCSGIDCIKKSYEERIDVLIGKYVLIMSKDDNLCGHMLNLYNRDLDKYGEVRYNEHEEFNWIKWEDKTLK